MEMWLKSALERTESCLLYTSRGVARARPTWFYQKGVWVVNGKMDQTDLRHSVEYGNWVTMESLKYNNKASKYFGQPLRLFDEQGK